MEELNLFLFLWIAAGHALCPWLVSAAGALAVGGPWLCLGLLGWTAWLHPATFHGGPESGIHRTRRARFAAERARDGHVHRRAAVFASARAAIAVFAAALLTGWARIHVGVHFPADIPAGLLLALGVTVVFAGLQRLCRRTLASVNVAGRAGHHEKRLARRLHQRTDGLG